MESERIRKNSTLICAPIMVDSVGQTVIEMDKVKASGVDLFKCLYFQSIYFIDQFANFLSRC